jgi:Kinesin motor domain
LHFRVSYIEIYNETINDLLKKGNINLKVQEENGQVIIPGATEEPQATIEGIIALLEKGETNRRNAEALVNCCSSRSHAIFRLVRVGTLGYST